MIKPITKIKLEEFQLIFRIHQLNWERELKEKGKSVIKQVFQSNQPVNYKY